MGVDNQNLEVIYDHYKESFTLIRRREMLRDKLFIWVAVILGILFLEVHFPIVIKEMFTGAEVSGVKFSPEKAPMNIIASLTWAILFIVTIRYCQLCITIDRQYKYLHKLEVKISTFLTDVDLFTREGKSYKSNFPAFSSWA